MKQFGRRADESFGFQRISTSRISEFRKGAVGASAQVLWLLCCAVLACSAAQDALQSMIVGAPAKAKKA